ncbi:uncharacterized protein MELLADRAFT_108525 [Melampsora larici-populina 98AG31]|uniref:Secreted protein n=1 Tax=Melampsora larici-populina (strain 98AG31 / pathotype 3-4-7) TaxID=747676 RepID=F4RTD3_MELLP|nr:uncharacterized protein MELLADRAFT_108525 [Melampsora larici-populina 98AG31]EGG04362.1 hypothetical protein MELLADRAFT_108525 [Melampsora larici-populina 98AG31]
MVILWSILIFPILVSAGQIPRSAISQKFTSATVLQHPLLHRRMAMQAAHNAILIEDSAGGLNQAAKVSGLVRDGADIATLGGKPLENAQANVDIINPSLKTSHIPDTTHLDIQHAAKNPIGDGKHVQGDQASSLNSVKTPEKVTKGGEPSTAQLAQGDSPKSDAPFTTIQASQYSRSPSPSTSSGQLEEGSTDPCLLRRYRRKRGIPPCILGMSYPPPDVPNHPAKFPENGQHARLDEPPMVKPTLRSKLSTFARTPPTVSIKNSAKKVGKHSAGLFKSAVGLTAATFYLAAKPFIIGGKWVGWAIGRTAKATIVVTGKGLRLFYKGAKTSGAATATGVVKTAKFGVKAAKVGAKAVASVGILTAMGVLGGVRLVGKGVIGVMKLLARIAKMTLRGTGHLLAKTGEGLGKAGHKLKNIQRLRLA